MKSAMLLHGLGRNLPGRALLGMAVLFAMLGVSAGPGLPGRLALSVRSVLRDPRGPPAWRVRSQSLRRPCPCSRLPMVVTVMRLPPQAITSR